jgi:hypothetical protein
MLRHLSSTLVGALLCACSSTRDAVEPTRLRVGLFDYRSEKAFELVSETHTARIAQYGQVRAEASRKVQTDEVMVELVGWLEDEGFAQFAQPGPAPRQGGAEVPWAMEIETEGGVRHVAGLRTRPQSDQVQCMRLKAGFLDIYNNTYAGQAVEVREGESPFTAPEPARRRP